MKTYQRDSYPKINLDCKFKFASLKETLEWLNSIKTLLRGGEEGGGRGGGRVEIKATDQSQRISHFIPILIFFPNPKYNP